MVLADMAAVAASPVATPSAAAEERDAKQPHKVRGQQQPTSLAALLSAPSAAVPQSPSRSWLCPAARCSPVTGIVFGTAVGSACGSKASILCKREVLPACLPCGTEISPVVTRALCQLLSPT